MQHFDLEDVEEPGEIREPESPSSSQVRGGDTFTVSRFKLNRRKNAGEKLGFSLSEAQNDSSLDLWKF